MKLCQSADMATTDIAYKLHMAEVRLYSCIYMAAMSNYKLHITTNVTISYQAS